MAQKDLKAIRRRVAQLEKAKAALRDAIHRANLAGESVGDIVPWSGMSRTSVQRLLEEARKLEREREP